MILKRLIMNNFRQFEGSNKIDFTPIKDRHISIVFASNGVGKTTILTAIVWCLYGGRSDMGKGSKELPYGDLPEQFMNKNIFNLLENGENGEVEVILTFEDKDKEYVVTRKVIVCKEDNKQINKDFSFDVDINNERQYRAKEKIEMVLGSAMKEYFFFDGEGIGKLADSTKPELIQQGIKNVMKIDTRQSAYELLKSTKKMFDRQSAKIQEDNGIKNIPEKIIEKIEEDIDKLKNNLEKANKAISFFDKELIRIDEELLTISGIKNNAKKKKNFENEVKKLEQESKELLNNQQEFISKKAYLALSKDVFKYIYSLLENKHKQGELPILGIGKHFIEKLLSQNICICGENFKKGDSHHQHLIDIMNKTTIKSEIENDISLLETFIGTHKDDYQKFLEKLEINIRKRKEILRKKEQFQSNIDETLNQIENDLYKNEDNLATKQKEYKNKISKANQDIGKYDQNIKDLTKKLNKAKNDLNISKNINEEIELIRNRIEYCDEAMEMLLEMNKAEINRIRKELSKRLERKFDSILHSEKKAILSDEFHLSIIGKDGDLSAKSRGEDKLISLMFISTLIDLAREKNTNNLSSGGGIYPIVVDSPYGEFDTVYKKDVSKALKVLAPQVIILLSQEQWSQDLEDVFKDSLAHAYRLVANRPKLNTIENEVNYLYFLGKNTELEILSDREYTTIERLEVNI